ncbi:MAG: YraN family protein, partial [Bacteroidales bacterium]|nr:YraN family protein [Bacteroidales bacterium]
MNRSGESLPESYLTGKRGEQAAKAYLEARGYTVLAMNYRAGHREIDLIAQTGDRLVFVEVKTRAQNCLVLPQDAV